MAAADRAGLRYFRPLLLFIPVPLLAACTFIGIDNPRLRNSIDWGSLQAVPTCVYLDAGVVRDDADRLLGWWNGREAYWYKLQFVPVSYEPLKRNHTEIFFFQISSKLKTVTRPDRCVEQIWLVSRNVSDFAYAGAANLLGLPEVIGWTDDETRTKAWAYANAVPDLNQLLMPPGATTRHEIYHLLGCDHFDLSMRNCYQAIQNFKNSQRKDQGLMMNTAAIQPSRPVTGETGSANR